MKRELSVLEMVHEINVKLLSDGVDTCVIDDVITNPQRYVLDHYMFFGDELPIACFYCNHESNYGPCIKELYKYIVELSILWDKSTVTVDSEAIECVVSDEEMEYILSNLI